MRLWLPRAPEQVISVAQQTYDLLMPLGLGEDVCYNLEPKAGPGLLGL